MNFKRWLEAELAPFTIRGALFYVAAIAAVGSALAWGLVELVFWLAGR